MCHEQTHNLKQPLQPKLVKIKKRKAQSQCVFESPKGKSKACKWSLPKFRFLLFKIDLDFCFHKFCESIALKIPTEAELLKQSKLVFLTSTEKWDMFYFFC